MQIVQTHKCNKIYTDLWHWRCHFIMNDKKRHWSEALCHPQPNTGHIGTFSEEQPFCSLNVDHLWLNQLKMKVVFYRYLHHLRYPDNIYTFYQTSWHFIVWDYVWRNVVCWVSFCDCRDDKIEKLCRILICEITPGLRCWLLLGRGLPLL